MDCEIEIKEFFLGRLCRCTHSDLDHFYTLQYKKSQELVQICKFDNCNCTAFKEMTNLEFLKFIHFRNVVEEIRKIKL